MTLEINSYECYTQSQNDMVGYIRDTCNEFSYIFTKGIYFLTGEIDIGAWSFAYSLAIDAKNVHAHYKSIILNNKNVDLAEVQKQSFHVGQYIAYGKKSFESVIKNALKQSNSNLSYDDFLLKYGFSDAPVKSWKMNCVNQKIWYISTLIGLALNKQIFIFPWLSKKEYLSSYFQKAFDLLSNEDIITLVPCSEKIQLPVGENYTVLRMASLFNLFIESGFDLEADSR